MTLLQALIALWAIHANVTHVDALASAAAEHHADVALVFAIAVKESGVNTRGTILTGAMLHLPRERCPDLPRGRRCINRDPDAQAGFTARLFGDVPRRHWPRMLAGYVCGPNPTCQRTQGVAYAARVLAIRDRLATAMRRGR